MYLIRHSQYENPSQWRYRKRFIGALRETMQRRGAWLSSHIKRAALPLTSTSLVVAILHAAHPVAVYVVRAHNLAIAVKYVHVPYCCPTIRPWLLQAPGYITSLFRNVCTETCLQKQDPAGLGEITTVFGKLSIPLH